MRKSLTLIGMAAVAAVSIAACSSSSNSGSTSSATPTAISGKVAVLLPDSKSSARWETQDRPELMKAFQALGLKSDQIIITNAEGDKQQQATQADQAISQGAKVILLVNLDSGSGAAIQAKAKTQGVQSIDYDRLTLGGSAVAYVSFDNVKVGQLQGDGLVAALKALNAPKGAMVAELNGSPTDNNATLFAQGYNSVLAPLYADGTFTKGPNQSVPNWDNQTGGTIFQQMLTANPKIAGAITANDGLGNAAVQVLKAQGLAGKVPVTGQDATVQGMQNVLLGYQAGTVYKPIKLEADAAAKAAVELLKGATVPSEATNSVMDSQTNMKVAAILETPIWVTPANAKSTVFADGFVTVAQVCTADVAAKCTAAGIS